MRYLLRTACLFPLLLVSALPCQADTMDLFFAGGANFPRIYNQTPVNITSTQINNYVTRKATLTKFLAGIGVSYIFNNVGISPLNIGIGLAGYYNDFGYVKGTEYPFANQGGASALNYRFDAASSVLLAEGRLIYSDSTLHPYLLCGAGYSWNHLSNFIQSPMNAGSRPTPVEASFTNKTTGDFAYEAGVGIQYLLPFANSYATPVYYALDLSYRYMNLGKGELGRFPGQSTSNRLTVTHMSTQAVLFALTASI